MQIHVAEIPVVVQRKRVKYLRLRVAHDGTIILNLPWHCPLPTAEAFVQANAAWVRQHYAPQMQQIPTVVMVFGERVVVRIVHAPTRTVTRSATELVLQLRPNDDEHIAQQLLQRWYQRQLYDVLATLVPLWQHAMQTPPVTWRVRAMRSRWGSCTPRTRVLAFATGLVHYPHEVIAYVVIHELAHLFHANHAKPFWECVAQYCPEWRQLRAQLRQEAGC